MFGIQDHDGEGRDIINGGAFGPEGGLAVTVVLLGVICMVYRRDVRVWLLHNTDLQ